jgi:hypothetical protein
MALVETATHALEAAENNLQCSCAEFRIVGSEFGYRRRLGILIYYSHPELGRLDLSLCRIRELGP